MKGDFCVNLKRFTPFRVEGEGLWVGGPRRSQCFCLGEFERLPGAVRSRSAHSAHTPEYWMLIESYGLAGHSCNTINADDGIAPRSTLPRSVQGTGHTLERQCPWQRSCAWTNFRWERENTAWRRTMCPSPVSCCKAPVTWWHEISRTRNCPWRSTACLHTGDIM